MILRMSAIVILTLIAAPSVAQELRFDAVVAPLLIERCVDCHSGAKPKGKLDLTSKAATAKVIVAKNLKDSVLWQRIVAGEMPPKKPLPEKEKAILKAW